MTDHLERRVLTQAVELRTTENAAPRLGGYAALFNTETEIAGMFRERIAPGAFADAIGRDDVRALFNHDPNFVLGRTTNQTLTIREDARGLAYDVTPPDTQWARDLMVSVGRGDITQSSFGFTVDEDQWDRPAARGELPVRTILRAKLFDVSAVAFPAYAQTSVAVRSQVQAMTEPAAAALIRQQEHARRRNRLLRAERERAL